MRFEPTDMVPSMEFITGLSAENLLAVTGVDPRADFQASLLRLIEVMQIDIHGPLPFQDGLAEAVSQEQENAPAQASWGLNAGSQVEDGARQDMRFDSPEDVLRFEPLEWDQKSELELLDEFQAFHQRNLDLFESRCVAEEDIYTTLFHWCIDTFGWENFMLAAAIDEKRFEEILLQFKELSIRRTRAWAKVEGLEFFMCHDDLCMTRGPVFSPDWYRKYIFPHYADIWAPLKAEGRPVVFISDGNYIDLVDDIAACEPDGFIFDHTMDFPAMIQKFGGSKLLFGGPDVRVLTFASPEEVESAVKKIFEQVHGVPGYFYCTAGSLPENIPLANLQTYLRVSMEQRAIHSAK